jgi:glutamine amidotransferase
MLYVVNYHAGNAPSVGYALAHLGIEAKLASSGAELEAATKIILPGVGSAKATMDSLAENGLRAAIEHKVRVERVPFLGICIGLQVLFDHSDEGDADCLGWIPGRVRRFPDSVGPVPQIGWNEVTFGSSHPLVQGLRPSEYVYFVNSYFAAPEDERVVLGKTNYGGVEFCSAVAYENVCATQFHVEKSGPVGLRMLANFCRS